jgi:putative heme transporter
VTTASGPAATPEPAIRPRWTWKRWVLLVVAAALLAVAVRAEEPMLTGSVHSFAHLRWRPVFFAVLCEIGSMAALALLERRILLFGGFRVSRRHALALAYASNAMSVSLPIVGSGAATAYTYKRLVNQGAPAAMTGWALTLAGVLSSAAFVLLISAGAIISGNSAAMGAGAGGIVLTAAVAVAGIFALRRHSFRDRLGRGAVWSLGYCQRLVRRPAGDPATLVAGTMSALGAFRPVRRDVTHAISSAFRNWILDMACLIFSIRAVGVHVPWWGFILAWAAGAGGSSLNLTPGGLGVVEAALTGALVALGVPSGPALTAVLVYRGITFWLAIAIGWTAYWWLSRRRQRTPGQPAPAPAATGPGPAG